MATHADAIRACAEACTDRTGPRLQILRRLRHRTESTRRLPIACFVPAAGPESNTMALSPADPAASS